MIRLVALALTIVLLAPVAASAQTTEEPRTLSVIGRGQVELRPDLGGFSVSVSLRAPAANAARSRTNARIRAIVNGLVGVGVERDQLTTSRVSIRRQRYRTRENGPEKIRYEASVSMRVANVEGLSTLARAIDVASKRGATSVFGPQLSFSAERRAAGRLGAEADALRDARTRAEAAAAIEGQRIVGVQSIDLDPGRGDFSTLRFGAARDSAGGSALAPSPTQIFSARRKVTAEAAVTYLIEPAA